MDAREKLEEHKNKRIYIYIYIIYQTGDPYGENVTRTFFPTVFGK